MPGNINVKRNINGSKSQRCLQNVDIDENFVYINKKIKKMQKYGT